MPDREKVIKGVEEVLSYVLPDEKDASVIIVKVGWVRDALKLLKEQEDEIKELRSIVEFWKETALHT